MSRQPVPAGSVSGGGSGGGAPTGAAGGDLTGTYPNPTVDVLKITAAKIAADAITTAKILDANVTLAKLANMATASLLGRATAATGVPEVLSAAQAKTLLAIDRNTDITGTLTVANGGTGVTTIAAIRAAILAWRTVVITEAADAFTIVDVALGDEFRCALTTGTNNIGIPAGTPYGGQVIAYRMEQDGTGSRGFVFNTGALGHKFTISCPVPTPSTAASAVDEIYFRWDATSSKWVCIGYNIGIA